MISFKTFIKEMAKPLEKHRSMVFYHGTTNGEGAQKIIQSGQLIGRSEDSRALLAPVKNRVYITPHIHFAQIHAIGGDMAGHDWWPNDHRTNGDHGYIFQVNGEHLNDIQPDEDDVGQMSLSHNNEHGIHNHLINLAKTVATPNQLKRAKYGEYAYQSAIGKKMLKHMSDADKLHFIDKGAHIATEGPVKISRAWKIHKSKVKLLKRDGSNFFDHAEEIPLNHNKDI